MSPGPCLEFIGKLVEFVQIDPWLKSEIVGSGGHLFSWGGKLLLGDTAAQSGVDHFFETEPLPLGFAQEDGG